MEYDFAMSFGEPTKLDSDFKKPQGIAVPPKKVEEPDDRGVYDYFADIIVGYFGDDEEEGKSILTESPSLSTPPESYLDETLEMLKSVEGEGGFDVMSFKPQGEALKKNEPTDQEIMDDEYIGINTSPPTVDEVQLPDGKVELEFPNVFTGSQVNFESLQVKAIEDGLTGEELAAFLAQTKHESIKFSTTIEQGSDKYFDKYEPSTELGKKLGNTQKGDGKKFKGRGYIQITGRSNYTQVGKALGLDLLNNPELLEIPENAAKASIWWWKNNVRPKVPNKDFSNNYAVSGLVNRGSANKKAYKLAERETYYKQFMGLVPTESPRPKIRPLGIMSREQ
jgi:putative chitinase